jgi:hypothetical protein
MAAAPINIPAIRNAALLRNWGACLELVLLRLASNANV